MSVLTINGTVFNVSKDAPTELPTESGGNSYRNWNGGLRSTARWEKRGWRFKSVPVLQATVDNLKSIIALKAQVPCAGDFAGGASVVCEVSFEDAPYLTGTGSATLLWRIMTITLREV